MKIAVGYVRCSTDMQDDSVEQQKQEIQKWAAANDYKIIEWYEDEGKSGTSFEKRPAFMRLMRRVESGANFEHILVYDESRWGRPNNPRENTYWKVHAERYGVRVRVINSSSKNENDIGSFVTEVVESAEASEYSKKLARATLRGSIANAQKGYSSGGTAPYAYVRVAVDKDTGQKIRVLKPGEWIRGNQEKVVWDLGDPAEVEIVKRIFELKASGRGYVMVADRLNREGVPCPKRGRWRNKDQKWCQGSIRAIVTNMAYCGVRVYNKHPQSHMKLGTTKRRWINDPKDWIILENAHPAIVSKELFEKANSTNQGKFGKGNPQIVKSAYLLSGLMKCGKCGFNFAGQRYHKSGIHYYQDSGYT
ncbi:MAG TPA: recombinase family protein, partial [Bacteroidota bacterium]|nr:recombinase family protein [Bacteroidota bacterium]